MKERKLNRRLIYLILSFALLILNLSPLPLGIKAQNVLLASETGIEIVSVVTNETHIFVGDRFHMNITMKNTGDVPIYFYPSLEFNPQGSIRFVYISNITTGYPYFILDPQSSTCLTDPYSAEYGDAYEAIKPGVVLYNITIEWGTTLDQYGMPIFDHKISKMFSFVIETVNIDYFYITPRKFFYNPLESIKINVSVTYLLGIETDVELTIFYRIPYTTMPSYEVSHMYDYGITPGLEKRNYSLSFNMPDREGEFWFYIWIMVRESGNKWRYACSEDFTLRVGEGISEKTLFFDNFENYERDLAPCPPWRFCDIYKNASVTDSFYFSPSKSLLISWDSGGETCLLRNFEDVNDEIFGYEFYIMCGDNKEPDYGITYIGFVTNDNRLIEQLWIIKGKWGKELWTYVDSVPMCIYDALSTDRWYKIELLLDRKEGNYSIWLDGFRLTNCGISPSMEPLISIGGFFISSDSNVAYYIDDVRVFTISKGKSYQGYLSDLSAKYDESTQRMFYNWTVNVESGTGKWTTKFSLYHTVSEYWKDFQSVPAKWNITTVEFMPPGYSYQWKVELYDPEGNLVDTKWGQASSYTHTNPTISVNPEKQYGIPGSTLTYTVSITNNDPVELGPSTFSLTYSVPSGWSASLSKTSVTLNPGETDSSIILSITSPTTASAGEYAISVIVTNMQAESYQGVGLAKYIIKETPYIESVILNRNPGITTMVGFTWSWKPPLYTAKMPSLGVFAQVVVTNPLTQSFSGRLRVYFTDPQGHENEHFTGWAESKIHFDIDACSKKTLFIPINDYGEGLWKIRFALEINGQISDQKSVNLEVLGWTETIDGPKDLGYTIPVQEFLQAERPGITEAALSVLDIIYLLLQAKYGVKDPDSLWNLLPSSGSTYDAVKISNALSCTTWTFLDVEKTASPNQYVVKATYEVTPYYYFEGQYTFYAVYDRAVTVILLPSGVDVLDSGNADFVQKTSDGETVITWVDNYCDKILRDVTPKKSHQLLIQVSEGRTFKITSHTYFEIGPHWPKPEKNSFPIINYQAWNQNLKEVYWILMNTKSISRDVVGSTVMLKESQHRLLLHIYDLLGRHVGWNSNNQVEDNIPGAIYFDDLNGTILVYLPANITNFKISVNAQYANESIETYELNISSISSAFVFNKAAYQASIEKGKTEEYEVNISEDGAINLKPIASQILYQYLLIFSVILIVAVGCGVYTFIKRRRRIVTKSAKVS